jgi:DNA-binding LacI/PurR family transcriptional regulator
LSKRPSAFGRSLTVGFLIANIEEGYQGPLLRGAIDGALEAGANFLCFAGGVLGRAEGGERARVFDLAMPGNIDALVIAAGAIGNWIDTAQIEAYCERFKPLPMCSIAVELGGMSSVRIDNESGMRAVLEHLFSVHGMRRIAFVRGPANNADAGRRFDAYVAALAAEGIPVAPELIVSGDFQEQAGTDAVGELLDRRRLSLHELDAIVVANDNMAIGVIAELTRRGIRVPDQVAVVGFDDVEEARLTLPPLTTVRQPLYEQGRDAVRTVLRQVRLGTEIEQVVRRTELVVRQSCGCLGQHNDVDVPGSDEEGSRLGFEAAFVGRKRRSCGATMTFCGASRRPRSI